MCILISNHRLFRISLKYKNAIPLEIDAGIHEKDLDCPLPVGSAVGYPLSLPAARKVLRIGSEKVSFWTVRGPPWPW